MISIKFSSMEVIDLVLPCLAKGVATKHLLSSIFNNLKFLIEFSTSNFFWDTGILFSFATLYSSKINYCGLIIWFISAEL